MILVLLGIGLVWWALVFWIVFQRCRRNLLTHGDAYQEARLREFWVNRKLKEPPPEIDWKKFENYISMIVEHDSLADISDSAKEGFLKACEIKEEEWTVLPGTSARMQERQKMAPAGTVLGEQQRMIEMQKRMIGAYRVPPHAVIQPGEMVFSIDQTRDTIAVEPDRLEESAINADHRDATTIQDAASDLPKHRREHIEYLLAMGNTNQAAREIAEDWVSRHADPPYVILPSPMES